MYDEEPSYEDSDILLKQKEVRVKFYFPNLSNNEIIILDYPSIYQAIPSLHVNENKKDLTITIPDWIMPKELMEYFYTVRISNDWLRNNHKKVNINKVLKISEYFQNYDLSNVFIKTLIIENLDITNSLEFLKISYEKLGYCADNSIEADPSWFELFYACLETMSKNIFYHLDDSSEFENLMNLNKKLQEELIEKSFSYLIVNNVTILGDRENRLTTNSLLNEELMGKGGIYMEDYEKLIEFLKRVRNVDNIFDLLTNEYLLISSESNILELSETPNPTFEISIPSDLNDYNYYNEFQVDLNSHRGVVFVIYYKKSDDSLNVSLKFSQDKKEDENLFKIFSLLSIVKICDDSSKNQVNIRSVTNNKSLFHIFKMNNFKQYLKDKKFDPRESISYEFIRTTSHNKSKSEQYERNELLSESNKNTKNFRINGDDTFQMKIYLRICYIHTALSSYLLKTFPKHYLHPNINKISSNLFKIILKNKFLNKDSEDQVLTALLNWLNDEINLNDDISDILETINWNSVNMELLFIFLMKHYKMIETYEMENFFFDAFGKNIQKHKQNGDDRLYNSNQLASPNVIIKMITSNFLKACRNLNYSSLFLENKKNLKLNMFHSQSQVKNFSKIREFSVDEVGNYPSSIDHLSKYTSKDHYLENSFTLARSTNPAKNRTESEFNRVSNGSVTKSSKISLSKSNNFCKKINTNKKIPKPNSRNVETINTKDNKIMTSISFSKLNIFQKEIKHSNHNSNQITPRNNNEVPIKKIKNISLLKPNNSTTPNKTAKNVRSVKNLEKPISINVSSSKIIKTVKENKKENSSTYDALSYYVKKNPSQEKTRGISGSKKLLPKKNENEAQKSFSTNKLIEKMMNLNLRSKWKTANGNSQSLGNLFIQNS